MIYNFVAYAMNSDRLVLEIEAAVGEAPINLSWTAPSSLAVEFDSSLNILQSAALTVAITTHIAVLPAETLAAYLEQQVEPFIDGLLARFGADNAVLGLNAANKEGEMMSLFCKYLPVPSSVRPNNIKDCFDMGALTTVLALLQYVRDHPTEYSDLTPYITDTRLANMQAEIQTFLGI